MHILIQKQEEKKSLLPWKRYFENHRPLFRKAISKVRKLSAVQRFRISGAPIYLVSDRKHHDKEIHAWFSWSPQKSFVVVEIPEGFNPPAVYCQWVFWRTSFFTSLCEKIRGSMRRSAKLPKKQKEHFRNSWKEYPAGCFWKNY